MRYILLQLALLIAFLTEIRLDFSSLVLLKATTGNVSIMSLLHEKLISWSTVELEIVRKLTVKNSCWSTYPADENYSVSCTHGIATHIYADILSNILVATLNPPPSTGQIFWIWREKRTGTENRVRVTGSKYLVFCRSSAPRTLTAAQVWQTDGRTDRHTFKYSFLRLCTYSHRVIVIAHAHAHASLILEIQRCENWK